MDQNPPAGFPRITPYLLYKDVDRAVDFLVGSFGFTDRCRMAGSDGRSVHAENQFGDGVVMMGNPGVEYRNPKQLGSATGIVFVYVDDVRHHHDAAKAAGAKVVCPPADQFYGDRTYAAEDPEGHQWAFARHVRDVPPENMHP
jgi:PhnB protein